MPKGMKPCRRQIQFLQNLVQLASDVALTEGRAVASLKHSTSLALSQMRSQHVSQRRFDVDRSVAPTCLDRNLFAIPDATAYVDSVGGKVQVFDMQSERFAASQPRACQCRKQCFPPAARGVNDLKHFLGAEAS